MENKITFSTKNYFLQISFNDEQPSYEILKEAAKKLEEKATEMFLNK